MGGSSGGCQKCCYGTISRVVPFSLSGDWQRALVAVSTVPFVASLAWRNMKNVRTEHNPVIWLAHSAKAVPGPKN